MIPEYQERVAFRLSTKQRQLIERLIKQERFKNISEVIRVALEKFLEKESV